MTRRIHVVALLAGVALAAGIGCATKTQDAPALSGPSELSTAIAIYASPDTIAQDGATQSSITIQARDVRSQPIANLSVRLDTSAGGVVADFGQLSARQLTTNADGRATATYTAPNAAQAATDILTSVTIVVTPVGADASSTVARSVTIRLTQPSVIVPPGAAPKAVTVYSPSNPIAGAEVIFDGGTSSASGARIVGYAWDFGDGSTGGGSPITHRFALGGTFAVRLTVTDDRSLTGTASTDVTVRDTAAPSADFVYSPSNPVVNQRIVFDASSSAAAIGRSIASYGWNFGNDGTATGVTAATAYGTAQSYTVSLTVTDDLGKKTTVTKTLSVAVAEPLPQFTYLPVSPFGGQIVAFNGTGSSSTYPITNYAWDFGDGSVTTGLVAQHAYAPSSTTQTYVVRLTVSDSSGATGSATQAITVKAGNGLVPTFTFSPSDPIGQQTVYFNGSASSGPNAIGTYAWDFGDGTTATGATAATNHAFAGCLAAGGTTSQTFVVRLTVTDLASQTATTTLPVAVRNCK